MDDQQFCLRWNNFQAYITSQFENLRDNDDFVDVTLACGGQKIGAHKVVLSACSPFFKELFKTNPCPHPIIFMRDVEPETIMSLLEFMYAGEVNVAQTNLTGFLRTAESLQIRGLTEANTKPKNYSTLDTKNFENYENKSNKVSSTKNEIENDKDVSNVIETINPISMLSQGHLNCEMDLVEPKMEPNEYVSEEEVEGETEDCHDETLQDYQNIAMENDNNSLPGTSAPSFDGFGNINSHGRVMIHDESNMSQNESKTQNTSPRNLHSLDPRPCNQCGRIYSNLSNLRQHIRLIHNPQNVSCPVCKKHFKSTLYLKRHLATYKHQNYNHDVIKKKLDSNDYILPTVSPT